VPRYRRGDVPLYGVPAMSTPCLIVINCAYPLLPWKSNKLYIL
jgi:hypothetical protein